MIIYPSRSAGNNRDSRLTSFLSMGAESGQDASVRNKKFRKDALIGAKREHSETVGRIF